jgi:hypothetical protein
MNKPVVKSVVSVTMRAFLVAVIVLTSTTGWAPQPVQAAAAVVNCTTPALYSATGTDTASLQAEVDAFRNAIGALNSPQPINHVDGRRQIDWDAAPDSVSAPNAFPGDFFNAGVFPRARGIEFTTPGTALQLSATATWGAGIEFANIEPTYADEFTAFSAERLFAPLEANVVDVRFFSPADQSTPALVDSFGVVFTDVDLANVTKLDFYDVGDNLIYTQYVEAWPGSETLSLAGLKFAQPCIYRIRITTGNIGLQAGVQDGVAGYDVVAMDDFIYGEPQPITSCGLPTVYEATGSHPAEVQSSVDAYRAALGALNANAPFNNLDGRRQIDWDAVPDALAAPNAFPGNFFNADVFPRARGIAFSTEGTGFQLSATAASGAGVEFANINEQYAAIFQTFSPQRLFTPLGSNVMKADFFDPAQQTTRARVDGFGAVFSDVDLDAKTTISYYDAAGKLLYKQGVQAKAGDEGLSFAGVKFDSSCVSFVELTNGTSALGKEINDEPDSGVDLVVIDDFIFGEPVADTVCGAPEIFTAAGADAAAITPQVEAYRTALGALNPFAPQNFPTGRRQIDWDAAPDAVAAPNAFPGNFFNFTAAPRARGIEFTTNGSGLQLSATAASGVGIEFDNINHSYSATFGAFSPERLFSPIGSNTVDARFFDPANPSESALTTGFGAVFSDVDLANVTAIKYYDADNKLVYAQSVPAVSSADRNIQESFSFAGLKFATACVARVRLINGTTALDLHVKDDPTQATDKSDLVVMDDFIFGEPQPAQIDVNAVLNLVDVQKAFDRTPQENAEFGVFTIQARFKHVGAEPIKNMSFVVTELSNGNTLLNSTNGALGAGASFPVPGAVLGADEVLAPGESFTVDFVIGINQFKPFTLLVNAFGSIGAGVDGTVDLGWNYLLDSDLGAAGQREGNQLYLPAVFSTGPAR